MRKLIFLILITLFAAYAGWAERRPVGHYLSDLRSQVSVVQGQPGERGNLLAVQPELFTPDYQSAERLQLKFHAYLENARRQGLLNERTVVVFPEHVGTWLVASGEKPEVYAAADWPTAMDWMAASNPLKVARGWITARGDQRLTDTLFRMKAVDMAHDYQTLFGGLAHDFKVTVVAGSIVLPDPEVEDGELRPGTGQLYNVSLTFGPDGRPLGQPQRKVFPTRHELSYLNNDRGERLQVLDTPAGHLRHPGRTGRRTAGDPRRPEPERSLAAALARLRCGAGSRRRAPGAEQPEQRRGLAAPGGRRAPAGQRCARRRRGLRP